MLGGCCNCSILQSLLNVFRSIAQCQNRLRFQRGKTSILSHPCTGTKLFLYESTSKLHPQWDRDIEPILFSFSLFYEHTPMMTNNWLIVIIATCIKWIHPMNIFTDKKWMKPNSHIHPNALNRAPPRKVRNHLQLNAKLIGQWKHLNRWIAS